MSFLPNATDTSTPLAVRVSLLGVSFAEFLGEREPCDREVTAHASRHDRCRLSWDPCCDGIVWNCMCTGGTVAFVRRRKLNPTNRRSITIIQNILRTLCGSSSSLEPCGSFSLSCVSHAFTQRRPQDPPYCADCLLYDELLTIWRDVSCPYFQRATRLITI